MPLLPITDKKRKQVPVYDGFMVYFPDAMVAVAQHSFESNEQHNPGEPLHWDRSKSTDQLNTLARHLLELADGELSPDEELAAAKAIAWRSMANLQLLIEERRFAVIKIDHEEWAERMRFENSESQKLSEQSLTDAELQAEKRTEILAPMQKLALEKKLRANKQYIESLNVDWRAGLIFEEATPEEVELGTETTYKPTGDMS